MTQIPEKTKIIVLANGIPKGAKSQNPSGIQKPPKNKEGSTLYQKKAQKNPKKKSTSDKMKSNIPIRRFKTKLKVCFPKKTPSKIKLENQP